MTHIRTTTTALLAAGALCAAPAAALAAPAHSGSADKADVAFARSNARVNLAEITLAKIGLDNSKNASVRHLARVTLSDHEQAEKLLARAAKAEGITLPTRPSKVQLKTAAHLEKLSGKRFNVDYLTVQVTAHKKSIAATEVYLGKAPASKVKRYAKKYLPVAKSHLKMATKDLSRLHK